MDKVQETNGLQLSSMICHIFIDKTAQNLKDYTYGVTCHSIRNYNTDTVILSLRSDCVTSRVTHFTATVLYS
jgi:hypothetical protein